MVATQEAPAQAGTVGTTNTETGQAQAPATQAEGGQAKAKRTLNGVYVQTPPALRTRIEEVANNEGKSAAQYVRDMLATALGVTLPPARTRTKYATPEQKIEAQKAKRVERQELIKRLLAEHAAKAAAEAAASSTNGVAHAG